MKNATQKRWRFLKTGAPGRIRPHAAGRGWAGMPNPSNPVREPSSWLPRAQSTNEKRHPKKVAFFKNWRARCDESGHWTEVVSVA